MHATKAGASRPRSIVARAGAIGLGVLALLAGVGGPEPGRDAAALGPLSTIIGGPSRDSSARLAPAGSAPSASSVAGSSAPSGAPASRSRQPAEEPSASVGPGASAEATVPPTHQPLAPSAELVLEGAVGPANGQRAVDATGFEPIVATHPTDPDTIAVAYQRFGGAGSRCGILAGLRISHDGGRTWTEAPRHPWDGTSRSPSFHSAIAWGPGATAGSARLYWIDTTVPGCDYARHRVAISYSDDEGRSWSPLQVQTSTPAWIGGFPDISVDRDSRSPGFGTVYAVYNWPGPWPARGPGLRLLVSRDFGRSWGAIEIGPATPPAGYAIAWRLGYRVRPAPDGAYVSWFQADLRRWDPADFFDRGGVGNVGRAGFVVVHVHLDASTGRLAADPPVVATAVARNGYTVGGWTAPGTLSHSYPDPTWSHGLDVDPSTGRVYLAVGDSSASASPGSSRGSVRVGVSEDGGRTWRWRPLPVLTVGGRPVSPFRPTLAVAGDAVVLGMHWIADRAGASGDVQVGEAWAVSFDGERFTTAAIPGAAWPARALASAPNGPGLRDRAAATADGRIVYVYGDGRRAAGRASTAGPSSVFAAVIVSHQPRADGSAR